MSDDYENGNDHNARIKRLEVDMWYGRGRENPSITSRMAVVERDVEDMKDTLKSIVENSSKMNRLLIGTAIGVAGNIILAIVLYLLHIPTK